MDILLVRPPSTFFKNTAPPITGLPIGILYIASTLQKEGHNVEIFDAQVKEKGSPISRLDSEIHFGISWEMFNEKIKSAHQKIIGISNQYSAQFNNALLCANKIKEIDSSKIVIIGGPHASADYESMIKKFSYFDIIVVGEGEKTMVGIANCFDEQKTLDSIKGVVFRDNKGITINQKREFINNLDSIPFPAYDSINMERYFELIKLGFSGRIRFIYPKSERAISMITSRGCPYSCVFCSIHINMGKKWRAHSTKYVLNHIEFVKNSYNVKHIHFEDDNITMDPKRFEEILDGIIDNKLKITWDAPNGVRADYLNMKLLQKVKKSGCTYLRIGIESGDQFVLNEIIKKRLDLNKVMEVAKLCSKIGIDLEGFYIIGFPGEKISQMKKTIDLAINLEKKYNVYPYDIFLATPLFGTELYRISKKKGYLIKELTPSDFATATQGEGVIETEDFTVEDLKNLLNSFRKRHINSMRIQFIKFSLKNPKFLVKVFLSFLYNLIKEPLRIKSIIRRHVYMRHKNCFKEGIKC